jgi:hypothetical protein
MSTNRTNQVNLIRLKARETFLQAVGELEDWQRLKLWAEASLLAENWRSELAKQGKELPESQSNLAFLN